MSDITRINADKINVKDIDRRLFNVFSEQIFQTGFVHADPHPGNSELRPSFILWMFITHDIYVSVFIRKGENNIFEIVLLDHGLYETISPETRLSLCNFWESIVFKDVLGMNKYAKELNVDGN